MYFLRINGMGHLCAFWSHQKMQYACATESTLRCDRMKGQLFFRKVKYCYENKKFSNFSHFPARATALGAAARRMRSPGVGPAHSGHFIDRDPRTKVQAIGPTQMRGGLREELSNGPCH